MKRIFAIAAALSLSGSAVLAGDWTGPYLGGQIGYLDVSPTGVGGGNGGTVGLHAGYDYDFGDWVLGGELEWDSARVDIAGGTQQVDNIGRAKIKLGYDFGQTLGYAVVGAARIDTTLGNETGTAYGLGLAFQASPQISISGEYLRHNFDNIGGSGIDADADSLNLRVSFRF